MADAAVSTSALAREHVVLSASLYIVSRLAGVRRRRLPDTLAALHDQATRYCDRDLIPIHGLRGLPKTDAEQRVLYGRTMQALLSEVRGFL